jgi:AraC-like DNA-binding protein
MRSPLDSLHVIVHAARRSRLNTNWKDDRTRDPYARLYLVEKGGAYIRHHGETLRIEPAALHIIPADTVLSFWCDQPFTIAWVHFTATVWDGLDLFRWLPGPTHTPLDRPGRVLRQLAELRRAHRSDAIEGPLVVKGLMLQILARYLKGVDRSGLSRRNARARRFAPVLKAVDEGLAGPLRIPDLARLVHLETTYFSTLFRKVFGVPPSRHILRRRVRKAQQLLIATDESIDRIASRTGFCDRFHLTRMFKRETGRSPAAFRAAAAPYRP